MQDATLLAIKAAIIESRAVEARQQAASPAMTGNGQAANCHIADALIWSVSVLTAEPMPMIRARVYEAARMQPHHDADKPRRAVA